MLTNNEPVFIEGSDFMGYIFPKEYKSDYFSPNDGLTYTPSKEDVIRAETILKEKIKEANKSRINQGDKCPVIHKQLRKYNRQYFGIIDKDGNKIIYINFIWKKLTPNHWNKEIIVVLDGCSYYWNVKVNIDDKKICDLSINGMG